jgi:hypothetical protein
MRSPSTPPPGAEYLTLAQHRRLAEAYIEDAEWLAKRTDAPMPPPLPERTAERPFLPTIAAAPVELRKNRDAPPAPVTPPEGAPAGARPSCSRCWRAHWQLDGAPAIEA